MSVFFASSRDIFHACSLVIAISNLFNICPIFIQQPNKCSMEIKGIMIVNKISSQQVKKQFYAENVTMINAGYALVKLTFFGLLSH